MDLPDFLTHTPHGDIDLTGHRIGLVHVVRLFNDGWTPEMIVGEFPTIRLALAYTVIGFYLDHQAEVDEYCRRHDEAMARLEAQAPKPDIAKMRARLEAMRQAELRPGA